MNKKQAAEFLGVTTRTVENYAASGRLSVIYMANKATYKTEELETLKKELETPVYRSIVATANESKSQVSESFEITTNESEIELSSLAEAPIAQLIEAFTKSQNLWRKLVWDLDEAATATGYSRFHLRSAIALGNLRARKVGRGWKIRPQDLEEYTNWLFRDEVTKKAMPQASLFV